MYNKFFQGIRYNPEIKNNKFISKQDIVLSVARELFAPVKNQLIEYESNNTINKTQKQVLDTDINVMFKDAVHCKNNHFYDKNTIFPLVPTFFENSLTYLPRNFIRNLVIEYSDNVFFRRVFHEHKYFVYLQMWVPKDTCPVSLSKYKTILKELMNKQPENAASVTANELEDILIYDQDDYDFSSSNLEIKLGKLCYVFDEKIREEFEYYKDYYLNHAEEFKLLTSEENDLYGNLKSVFHNYNITKMKNIIYKKSNYEVVRPEQWMINNVF
ncbi:uncharacterized protein ASCRUDRAFT_72244 [Ascoidea rubescens DSM 1968]|uniref:LicD/FKTN/FKRP nucleotidyltransferase domain-containing protein n=1 Tax=Ascoidea rubescens DSM 1968 TaxID=1344418 RepID=A0A1D2VBI1_9ASCO|nr:hypothetical protein ASCRUDRAFT_72244 [Ascoidea rubescens DSM 1968]ODV58833.1 hypothetical protein ASCRUDRAFT_72244 [Ascoidea rubescens DSM 1968]